MQRRILNTFILLGLILIFYNYLKSDVNYFVQENVVSAGQSDQEVAAAFADKLKVNRTAGYHASSRNTAISQGEVNDRKEGAIEILSKVLLNKTQFYSIKEECNLFLRNLNESAVSDEAIPFQIERFAVVDLDGDGVLEVILEFSPAGDRLILRYVEGIVLGYEMIPYRGMQKLQKNGTFLSSGGAADNSISRLRFVNTICDAEALVWSESHMDDTTSFYIHDNPTDDETFSAYMDAMKDDADWYEYNRETIIKWILSQPVSQEEESAGKRQVLTERQQYLDMLEELIDCSTHFYAFGPEEESNEEKEKRAGRYFDKWETELNSIYSLLWETLSSVERTALSEEQLQWQKIREQEAGLTFQRWKASEYSSGKAELLKYFKLMDITKRRTYQLIDLYFIGDRPC